MLSKNFEVGDLVWAKMKGFPPWPAKIIDPPSGIKSPKKKEQHYVYFFGSDNHAWVLDENIVPHTEQMLMKQNIKKKSTVLKSAIESIINFSKSTENKKSLEIEQDVFENDLEKDLSEVASSKDPALVEKPESRKKLLEKRQNKKKIMHKTSVKRHSSHSVFDRFKSKHSLNKNEGRYSLSSYSPSKMMKQTLTSLGNVINSEEKLVDRYKPATLKKIGFLGLGPMNRGIVKNLLISGHSVTVWNKSLETCDFIVENSSKHTKYATPAEVVKNSDIIFCCAEDLESAKDIIFDKNGVLSALEELKEEAIYKSYVEMTSLDPSSSDDLSEAIERTGAKYLEAPFSGSRKDIDDGAICIVAAGDRPLFDDCESCFDAVAKSVYYISPKVGDASRMNLISNSLCGTAYAALAEAMALAERLKIPDTTVMNVLSRGYLNCPGIKVKAEAIANRKFSTDLPLRHVQRDMSLTLLVGDKVDIPTPVIAAANEVYKHAKLLRYSDYDVSAVYQGIKY